MNIENGNYVLATKYEDGDPQDRWCVGYYEGIIGVKLKLHIVSGKHYRRVKKISPERGRFLIENMEFIERCPRSLWWWARVNILKTQAEIDRVTKEESCK